MKSRQKLSKIKSLYSRLKTWIAFHRNAAICLVIVALALLACTALTVGGVILGWDIAGVLTSPTAVLIYVVAGLASLLLTYILITKRK